MALQFLEKLFFTIRERTVRLTNAKCHFISEEALVGISQSGHDGRQFEPASEDAAGYQPGVAQAHFFAEARDLGSLGVRLDPIAECGKQADGK